MSAIVDRSLAELEADWAARGKSELFTELRQFIVKGRTDVREEADEHLFRKQVVATIPLGNRCDVDEEITYLMGLFER